MDLTKLSTEDLLALQAGKLDKVSTAGLQALQGQSRAPGPQMAAPDPTEGMSGFDKFVAGYGSAVPRMARGIGQRLGEVLPSSVGNALGLPNQADVDEANRLDAPLLKTGAGTAGNILGNVAAAIPAVSIPGAATIPGAAAIGAAQGLTTPTSTGESPLKEAAIGAAAGPAAIGLGRVLNALYRGGTALVEPFTGAGRDRIAGRVLGEFGVGAQDVAGLQGGPSITGARPMLAESIADPTAAAGAARLVGGLRSVDPRASAAFTAREVENNGSRVNTLRELAGDDSTRVAAQTARADSTADLYDQATRATYTVDGQLADLLKRPAVQQALTRAETLARNNGRTFSFMTPSPPHGEGTVRAGSKQISGQGLQDLKMAMDEMLTDPSSGYTGQASAAVKNLRGQILSWMESANPTFKEARTGYAAASRPLNQQDVAADLLSRGTSATSDLAGEQRLMPNALMRVLSDEKGLIEKGTGRRGVGNSLSDVFEPDQLAKIRGVASEVDRGAAVARAENGPGSATAQRLASQNVLRQALGPLGLPQSWSESTMLNTLMRPVQFAYNQVAEPRIQQTLVDAILDPSRAQGLIGAANPTPRFQIPDNVLMQLLMQSGRVAPSSAALGANR